MGIQILNTQEGCDITAELAFKKSLIPFIGAGFTANCKSKNGHCPSGEELRAMMDDMVIKYNGLTPKELESMFPLARRNDTFPRSAWRSMFLDYFTEVQLEPYKLDFLNVIDWPHIYTSNIDNAIETNGNFQALLPYQNHKQYELTGKPVYKIYGDAYAEAMFDDCEGIAFRNGYASNLTAKKNWDFVESQIRDYSNRNFIFVGSNPKGKKHFEYIFEQSNPSENLHRFLVSNTVPTSEEETNLVAMGVDRIILVEDFEPFYRTFVDCYRKFRL